MRAQVGSVWVRCEHGGLEYEVKGFDEKDRVLLIPVEYPASGQIEVHPTTFHCSFRLVKDAPVKAPSAVEIKPGSQWRVNNRMYTVTALADCGNTVRFESNHTSSVSGKTYKYRYDLARWLRTMVWVSDVSQPGRDKWADVERTLRAYNAANREAKRLETVLEAAHNSVNDARRAIDNHRTAVNKASAEYGDALRKMEDSVK